MRSPLAAGLVASAAFLLAAGASARSTVPPGLACPASVDAAGGTYTLYTGDPLNGPNGYTQTVRDYGDYLET